MTQENTTPKRTVVIGDGWAAMGAVALFRLQGEEVTWLMGTGARVWAPLPTLEAGTGARVWKLIAERLGVDAGELTTGNFLREFRNKSFRQPAWVKAPTPEMRRDVRNEEIWAPETRMTGVFEARFRLTLAEIEEAIRQQLGPAQAKPAEEIIAKPKRRRAEAPAAQAPAYDAGEVSVNGSVMRRNPGVPVRGFRIEDKQVKSVILGSGEEILADRVIFADRWSSLIPMEGLPKPIPFLRHRDPSGVFQVSFTHDPAVGAGLQEGFYGPIQRESGEEFQRNVWGGFSSDGSRSHWTILMAMNEVEDNHEIAKKFRRIKQALEKMFGAQGFLPEGVNEFQKTVKSGQLRFEEAYIFGKGDSLTEPQTLPKVQGLWFLTDAYGPGPAFDQLAALWKEFGEAGKWLEDAMADQEQVVVEPAQESAQEPTPEPPSAT